MTEEVYIVWLFDGERF